MKRSERKASTGGKEQGGQDQGEEGKGGNLGVKLM